MTKHHELTKAVNKIKPNPETSLSSVLHQDTNASGLKSLQHRHNALTPVNAGSLYWLI